MAPNNVPVMQVFRNNHPDSTVSINVADFDPATDTVKDGQTLPEGFDVNYKGGRNPDARPSQPQASQFVPGTPGVGIPNYDPASADFNHARADADPERFGGNRPDSNNNPGAAAGSLVSASELGDIGADVKQGVVYPAAPLVPPSATAGNTSAVAPPVVPQGVALSVAQPADAQPVGNIAYAVTQIGNRWFVVDSNDGNKKIAHQSATGYPNQGSAVEQAQRMQSNPATPPNAPPTNPSPSDATSPPSSDPLKTGDTPNLSSANAEAGGQVPPKPDADKA